MKEVRDQLRESAKKERLKERIRETRSQKIEDLTYNDGPDDGEDDADEELQTFLIEMWNKMKNAIDQSSEANFSKLVVCMKEKLQSEPYCFGNEFKDSGVLGLAMEFLEFRHSE